MAREFRRFDAAPGEASLVAYDRGLFAAVTSDPQCGGAVGNDRVSANLVRAMSRGHLWVNHAEPYDTVGANSMVALAVDVSGMIHDAAAWDDRDTFTADGDRGVVRPRKLGLPAIQAWKPVYAATRGTLFAVGGVDAAGRHTGQIWKTRIDDTHWRQVATSYRPANVLAATYVHGGDELWLLDQVGTRVRLVAIDLRDLRARTLGDWVRHATWDRHWLVAQPDGGVLVASSSSSRRTHAVSRVVPNGAVSVGPSTPRILVRAPVADEAGVSRVLRLDDRTRSATLARQPLVLRPGAMADLAAQL